MDCCLKDYVGIKLCPDAEAPDSGLFINSLPGLSIEALDNIADSEQTSYLGLWADAQEEAWARFQNDFFKELILCHDVDRHCEWQDLICDNKKLLVNAWRYLLGCQLMDYRLYSPRLNFFTLDSKEAKILYDKYEVTYNDLLHQAVKLLDTSSVKLPCGVGQIQSVTWLP